MFCHHCGQKLAEDANFCSKCGTAVVKDKKAPAAFRWPWRDPAVRETLVWITEKPA